MSKPKIPTAKVPRIVQIPLPSNAERTPPASPPTDMLMPRARNREPWGFSQCRRSGRRRPRVGGPAECVIGILIFPGSAGASTWVSPGVLGWLGVWEKSIPVATAATGALNIFSPNLPIVLARPDTP